MGGGRRRRSLQRQGVHRGNLDGLDRGGVIVGVVDNVVHAGIIVLPAAEVLEFDCHGHSLWYHARDLAIVCVLCGGECGNAMEGELAFLASWLVPTSRWASVPQKGSEVHKQYLPLPTSRREDAFDT